MEEMGLDPLPAFTPPYEFPENVPELAARYPLTLISSPAHQFLNSTFVNIDVAAPRGARAGVPAAPDRRRAARASASARACVVHNDRGAFTAVARVEDDDPPGRRVGAVDLVGQVRRGRRERESDDVAARDRPGARPGVLRQPGRGRVWRTELRERLLGVDPKRGIGGRRTPPRRLTSNRFEPRAKCARVSRFSLRPPLWSPSPASGSCTEPARLPPSAECSRGTDPPGLLCRRRFGGRGRSSRRAHAR